jgi:hypothetical protein
VPAYYRAPLSQFLSETDGAIVGQLTIANAQARFPLPPESIEAWHLQLGPLRAAISEVIVRFPAALDWQILLEYPIPRVGKRLDVVLLGAGLIVAIETKTGTSASSAVRQVEDYALNLACFHEGSHAKSIVPLVVASGAVGSPGPLTVYHSLIEPTVIATPESLPTELARVFAKHGANRVAIDPVAWDAGRFKPVPTIIEAAVALYCDMDVFEIGHASAARETLAATTEAITSAVRAARESGSKTICFVTGVPGAGKTLVGLNAVHQPEIRDAGAFLSGNGPLVKVIREALVRDVIKRRRVTRVQAELEVHTFVHNVHRFADEYYRGDARVPTQRVLVFDEAQRAWNATQNERAKRPAVSEPEMMLEVMDRHTDWTVLIALVGGGQEINRGEAGLGEWGRALAKFTHWQVVASPQVLEGGNAVAGFRLFDSGPPKDVVRDDDLHLAVSTRSIRAEKISDWANAVLDGQADRASHIANTFSERPVLCRSLDAARSWLMGRCRGNTRAGLVGSASAARLRADGLEPSFDFHQRFDWDHWFLDDHESGDVRRCSQLEVFATQFEIQGLELDWIGVCWGDDFVWDGEAWRFSRFTNRQWRPLKNPEKRMFLRNAYRVLLTRARHGMVLYVPTAHPNEHTRLGTYLEATAGFLSDCGAVPLGS